MVSGNFGLRGDAGGPDGGGEGLDGAKACRSEDGLIFVRLRGFFVLTAGW